MSLKRKLQYQYKYLLQSMYSWNLPSWLTCRLTRVFLIAVVVFFGAGYIMKTASTASTGYQINELEKTVTTLKEDIKKIEVDIADDSSLASVQVRLEKMKMVTVNKLSFYDYNNSIVAKK